ncbi:MFS transporter [Streptomyces iconiensis]|uniref:MFS transporter n=1 Tax=Streptomyces iconiensis TaxID=1384038 RepID=A0ABT7A5Z2_9ACTN|nr:MFS transporter [Streptomyces iconiensis]MDJ1136434.1 MFS transporter [Streptomyces iconiensis]
MPSAPPGVPAQRIRRASRTAFALHASVLIALLAASSAPTPLYSLYQDQWELSSLTVTVVFSAYALALLASLLTTGALSDHVGRRPVLAGTLTVQALSMVLFTQADGPGLLITARILQGLATGAATTAAGAALLDLEDPARPGRSAVTNSIAPVAGMATGVLAATLLVRFAPAPTLTVYLLLAALFALQAIAVLRTEETARSRPGAWRSLRPHITVPPPARRALLQAGTGIAAVWALGGFYSSLGPALVRLVAPTAPQAAGGMLFFTVTAAAALTVWALRGTAPASAAMAGCCAVLPAAALTLTGIHLGNLPAVFGGAVLAGTAFGAVSQGAVRMMLGPVSEKDRAATLATYYVLSYLSMSLPAVAAGTATELCGLRTTTHAYALTTALLAVAATVALIPALRTTAHTGADADSANTPALATAGKTRTHQPLPRTASGEWPHLEPPLHETVEEWNCARWSASALHGRDSRRDGVLNNL